MEKKSNAFGTEPLGKLLTAQAVPASIGILVMSIYGIVDTIFVGRFVGSLGIGAITVVLPITFLISSIGMAIGVGGASIISRALGKGNPEKAYLTFANQILLTSSLAIAFVVFGLIFIDEILALFGGKGEILEPAKAYFKIVLYGVPFLAWAMMSNNIIRAEGYPRVAMLTLVVAAIANIILDPIFIIWLDMGIEGAAWATVIAYGISAAYTTYYFLFGKGELKIKLRLLRPDWKIIREIFAIGSVTLARQGTISVLSIVLNNSLFAYGGELGLSTYGIINRFMMFANFPVLGITQGFVPIVGYNYGANLEERVQKIINISIRSATLIALATFAAIMLGADQLVLIFSSEPALLEVAAPALRMAFLATPLLAISLIGSAFFQAIGKAMPALLLALSKQGIFLIPLVLILPLFLDINGIWISFPLADIGAAAVTYWYMAKKGRRIRFRLKKT